MQWTTSLHGIQIPIKNLKTKVAKVITGSYSTHATWSAEGSVVTLPTIALVAT
jgi:hypothetical protein